MSVAKKEEARTESLNDLTYRKLKKDIMTFVLVPGDVISAQKVANRYQVSRTPAREAIVKLEKEGLLKILPKSGTYVARINLDRANQEWFVRMSLECSMADRFVENCNEQVLNEMKENLELLRRLTEYQIARHEGRQKEEEPEMEHVSRIDIDNSFHDMIYECSKEALAREIIDTQMTHYNRIRFLAEMNSEQISHKTVAEHLALIEAAQKKDGKAFARILKKHVRRIEIDQQEIIDRFPDYFEEQTY